MYLAYANVSEDSYPTPWVMWAGPIQRPGNHIGNIKFGYKNTGFWPFGLAMEKSYKSGTNVNIEIIFTFLEMRSILKSKNLFEIAQQF